MKNFFKSKLNHVRNQKFLNVVNIILISVLLIGFAFGLISNTYAQTCPSCPQFNICPEDKEALRLKNRTQGDTIWHDPISANCGDRVAFDIYYHNGVSGSVANNTKIRLDYPCTESSQIVTTAYLWADNASYVSDTGTINVTSPQRLIFDSTAKWYPNQGTIPTTISVTQVTACSVQVNIGDIQGNWEYQGHVVFEATLTPCATVPTVDIKANGSDGTITIPYNTSANLSWTSTNANSCYASGDWSGTKSTSGSESTGNLTSSRTYTITCTGTGGSSASDSVTVYISAQPTLYVYLTASPSSGCAPVNNVDLTANVSGIGSGNITYFFDCTNDGYWERTITESSTYYTVYDLCSYYSAGNYNAKVRVERSGLTAENTTQINVSSCYTNPAPTVDIKANGSDGSITIPYNSAANLTWTSTNANSCYASGDWSGTKSTSGSESTSNLTSSKTYTITCAGAGGSVSDSVTVIIGTTSGLSANKLVRNLTDNTPWQDEVFSDPGEFLAFSIQVTAPSNNSLSNVILTDTLPAKITYRENLKIDGVSTTGDIISGLNIGNLNPGQSKTITFDAQVADISQFGFGTTDLINTVSISSGSISGTDTAKVRVTKRAVAGVATGINILYFSLFFTFFFSLGLYFIVRYLENSQNPLIRKILGTYYKIRMFILR